MPQQTPTLFRNLTSFVFTSAAKFDDNSLVQFVPVKEIANIRTTGTKNF